MREVMKVSKYRFVNAKGEEKGSMRSEGQKLYILGDIVGTEWDKWSAEDTCPKDVTDLFSGFDKDKPVDVYINSGGGDVFGALAICSVIGRHLGEVTAHIDGIAASAASVIACACDKIVVPEYAQMMIHKPWSVSAGNSDDLRKAAEKLDAAEDSIVLIYKSKLAEGKTEEDLRQALADESWYTGRNIGEMFDVTVTSESAAAAAVSDCYGRYKHRPEDKRRAEKEAQKAAVNAVFEKYFR